MKIKLSLAGYPKLYRPGITTAFLLLLSHFGFSQAESPYSRYGLGMLRPQVFSANEGMGFLAAPYASAMYINSANPASYASLMQSTFEMGALLDGNHLVTSDSTYRSGGGSVDHFAIAFVPRAKNIAWAVCLGMLPYSNVNYNFVQAVNDSVLGSYDEAYTGSGSLYKVYVGGAIKVKGFSIGLNLGYIFGRLEYDKIAAFQDTLYELNTRNITTVNAKGFTYDVGIQYQKLIYHNRDDPDPRSDIYAFFGAYGGGGVRLTAKVSSYWDRFYYDVNDDLIVTDTLQSTVSEKSKINMPVNLGAGFMFGNERFWMVGADFKYSSWSNYTTPLDNGGLANSWQISAGAQVVPKWDALAYFKKVQYRIGGYYGKSEIMTQGQQLTQGGATLGFGLPLWKNVGHFNLTGDFGSLGGDSKDIVRVNYYRFVIGFVLNDIWFNKRKFD